MTSYKVEIRETPSSDWRSNGIRFGKMTEAQLYGADLYSRFMGMDSYRVELSTDAPNYTFNGTLEPIPPTYKAYMCGICDCVHPWDWSGDCRDDDNRFPSVVEYAESLGVDELAVELFTMDERVDADIEITVCDLCNGAMNDHLLNCIRHPNANIRL